MIIKIALKFGLLLPFYALLMFLLSLHGEHQGFIKHLARKVIRKSGKEIVVRRVENFEKTMNMDNLFVIANHRNALDPVLITALMKQPLSFAMKKDLDKGITKMIAKCTGSRFLFRTPKEDLYTIKDMVAEAREGKMWMVFPEGTRNLENNVKDFSAGIFKIPIASKATILPIVLYNSEALTDSNNKNPVVITFLPPVSYEEYSSMNTIKLSGYIHGKIEKEYKEVSHGKYAPNSFGNSKNT